MLRVWGPHFTVFSALSSCVIWIKAHHSIPHFLYPHPYPSTPSHPSLCTCCTFTLNHSNLFTPNWAAWLTSPLSACMLIIWYKWFHQGKMKFFFYFCLLPFWFFIFFQFFFTQIILYFGNTLLLFSTGGFKLYNKYHAKKIDKQRQRTKCQNLCGLL